VALHRQPDQWERPGRPSLAANAVELLRYDLGAAKRPVTNAEVEIGGVSSRSTCVATFACILPARRE
jgi:hypothetical protein